MLWTSDTASTVELGKCTGTNDHEKKPPLVPKKKRRHVVPVLYIDQSYCKLRERAELSPEWDARMIDVD